MRVCTEEGCEERHKAHGLCQRHYDRRKYHTPTGEVCSVDGCDRDAKYGCKGYCPMHFSRARRSGDPGEAALRRAPNGAGTLDQKSGRWIVRAAGHVLTDGAASSQVMRYRLVLFDKIGYGPHWCVWCGAHVQWRVDLVCDHVNGDPSDDRPENLVQSCMPCNSRDAMAARWHGRVERAVTS